VFVFLRENNSINPPPSKLQNDKPVKETKHLYPLSPKEGRNID
jgi:hypothetical protein